MDYYREQTTYIDKGVLAQRFLKEIGFLHSGLSLTQVYSTISIRFFAYGRQTVRMLLGE
ncbi:hypothetical protein [Mastigocladopsis repens]|uniref:hypothetical protein n=1 Tax=Mastigocladopsis repens TaxID=221287 RepID=UPI00031F4459|nr:hypothetical protein [Mastigocladopsis repens]